MKGGNRKMYIGLLILIVIVGYLITQGRGESYEEVEENTDDLLKTFSSEILTNAVKNVPPPAN